MLSKSRVAHIKNARQVAMYILSKDLSIGTPKIALEVGVKRSYDCDAWSKKRLRGTCEAEF